VTSDHVRRGHEAIPLYGNGSRRGSLLNLLDLVVYAVAKERVEPLLCTGKAFATAALTSLSPADPSRRAEASRERSADPPTAPSFQVESSCFPQGCRVHVLSYLLA
jgi:hypothetical protein